MTLSSLTDLANQLGIVDNKGVRLADLDTNIRAAVGDSSSITAISRTEFVEIMVRTAIDKYYKTGLVGSEIDALQRLINENLKSVIGRYDSDKWRYERYLTPECDQILTSSHDLLQKLFTKYCSKSLKYGDKSWMSLDEFSLCCKDLGLVSKSFGPRQLSLCYQLSLITHKDAVSSKGVNQMSFAEFMEGFSRVVDLIDTNDVESAVKEGKWPEEGLDERLEVLLGEVGKMVRTDGGVKKKRLPMAMIVPGGEEL